MTKFSPIIFLNKFPDNSPEIISILDFDNDLLNSLKIVVSQRKELATKYIIDTERAIYNNLFFENININLNYKLRRQS